MRSEEHVVRWWVVERGADGGKVRWGGGDGKRTQHTAHNTQSQFSREGWQMTDGSLHTRQTAGRGRMSKRMDGRVNGWMVTRPAGVRDCRS